MTEKLADPVPRRRAAYSEADLRRAMRAAKKEGFRVVELTPTPDGLKVLARLNEAPDTFEKLD